MCNICALFCVLDNYLPRFGYNCVFMHGHNLESCSFRADKPKAVVTIN